MLLCASQGIVRLLRQSDAQLFAGWGGYPGVNDGVMLNKLDQLASQAAALLKVTLFMATKCVNLFPPHGTGCWVVTICTVN